MSTATASRHHLTLATSNRKVKGNSREDVSTTTNSWNSCPPECPLRAQCYAKAGPQALHAGKVTSGARGTGRTEHLEQIAALPPGRRLRLHVSGDWPHVAGRISRRYADAMAKAAAHLRAWTYSHHRLDLGENLAILRRLNRSGLAVNASCETEAQADQAVALGLPAVLVTRSDETRRSWRTPAGNPVTVCPAQTSSDVSCADCMLCARESEGPSARRLIVAFLAHGRSFRRLDDTLATINAGA